MRSLKDLREVVDRSTGTCRISWSPDEAEYVLARAEALEERFDHEVAQRTEQVVTECHRKVREADIARQKAEQESKASRDQLAEREWQLSQVRDRTATEQALIDASEAYVKWCSGEGEIEEREALWAQLKEVVAELETMKAAEPAV